MDGGCMELKTVMQGFFDWLKFLYESAEKGEFERKWCTLGMTTSLSQESMLKFFERAQLNKDYVARWKDTDPKTQRPYAFIQAEIDAIYSTHKCMVARHKSRLAHYRDDLSAKKHHTWDAMQIAYGKFAANQQTVEKLSTGGVA